jgi:hypothetical protein
VCVWGEGALDGWVYGTILKQPVFGSGGDFYERRLGSCAPGSRGLTRIPEAPIVPLSVGDESRAVTPLPRHQFITNCAAKTHVLEVQIYHLFDGLNKAITSYDANFVP